MALALLQSTEFPWSATMGIGGALAFSWAYFYRIDRKSSEDKYRIAMEQNSVRWEDTNTRLEKLSADLLTIVQQNTQAVTLLSAALGHAKCPFADQAGNFTIVPKTKTTA